MSATPNAFPEENALPGESEKQNGRTDAAGEPFPEADRSADLYVPPHTSEEGVEADAAPADLITQETPSTPPPAFFEEPLFARYEYVSPPPRRRPDLGDCLLFVLLALAALLCSWLLMQAAIHYHLFGVTTLKQANDDIHYRIGSQTAWYVIILLLCAAVFPLAWGRSFFDGLQWRAAAATDRIGRLVGAASACFIAAIVDQLLMPGPTNTPIDQTFRMPGAVWLLFGFGVTLAPLIEEITYRGILLPAVCTAYDWTRERFLHAQRLPPEEDGFPRWSREAMIVASVVVSIPFALMHGEQTAYSIGPFLLLVAISLVLCWVRLAMRSLAASVVVHSSYNLLLFSLMFLGTSGFRHLDKM